MKILIKSHTDEKCVEHVFIIPRAKQSISMEFLNQHELHIYFNDGIKLVCHLDIDTVAYQIVFSDE